MGVIEKCCLALLVFGGCTKTVSQCSQDSDCTTAVFPFCDVNGEYAASGGDHNVCTIVPPNCPVERCGCEPGAVTCTDDSLTTCNADGKTATTAACSLGCDTADNRCFSFKTANGLDPAMLLAASEPAVVFPASVTIDTDACVVHDAANAMVAVKSLIVAQISAPSICTIFAGSLDISNAKVTGGNVVAFVATGPITLRGKIDESASKRFQGLLNAGPGSVTTGNCVGTTGASGNGGGGGNATPGAAGLFHSLPPSQIPGGMAQQDFEPLFGGCQGGGGNFGGGGGGAIQIDSLESIRLLDTGFLALGAAGGGTDAEGGGSGGNALLEAPNIEISGGVAANGGAGGAGGTCGIGGVGADATNDETAAPGGTTTCNSVIGGNGGTRTTPPTNGTAAFDNTGGGGAVGRVMLRTADGTFTGPGAIFSAIQSTDTLVKR